MFTYKIVDCVGLTGQIVLLDLVAVVAGAALAVVACSVYRSGRRRKRKDTLEALGKWADDTRQARRDVTRVLVENEKNEVTEVQAKALLGGPDSTLKDKYGTALDESERRKLGDQVRDILNGLEMIALGVQMDVYDRVVLRRMGRSVIARTYKQLEHYIKCMQNEEAEKAKKRKWTEKRQAHPYKELDTLYRKIDGAGLIETLEAERSRPEGV
ncbi:DUF4760 domain-containing protein [Mycobacterium sp. E2989]|uniref:DUF4760 domain-containing protein n=1 Tax=Mycobacterium sp. E2989 TaxID=1834140 RepID=UPI0007FFE5E6|nr:DUF4760 domain-containing protein [Mycobacterium sp. E2989]OBH82481.1 hypothetical protein A5680_13550 [Mycobacterium sp. E2989]